MNLTTALSFRPFVRCSGYLAAAVIGCAAFAGTAAAAGSAPVSASTSAASGFQDPTKNVRCGVKGSAVTCVIRRQDKAACARSYTASGTLKTGGPSVMNFGCFTGMPFAATKYKTLAYGKRKTIGGVTCVVTKKTGMRCSNAAKHGFTLRRAGSTSF